MNEDLAALHEAGHLVIAAVLGRAPRGATVNAAGTVLAGCVTFSPPASVPAEALDGFDAETPFILWPEPVRRRIEGEAMIALAGQIAQNVLGGPATGRVTDPIAESAVEDLQLLAGEQDRAWAEAVVDDPDYEPDSLVVARAAFVAVGRDPVAAAAWTSWMETQVRQLVHAQEHVIRRVAEALAAHKVLGGEALAALITGGLLLVPS